MAENADLEEEDNSFPQEELERIVNEVCEEVLKEAHWDETLVPNWINQVCEMCVKQLVELNRPYKWVVTCVMQQKIGCTIHSSMSCYWESTTDGVITYQFPPLQRQKDLLKTSIQTLVTVFGSRF